MSHECSHYLRVDCADGRYKDLHPWQNDHLLTYPGLVPVLASEGLWDDVVIEQGGLKITIAELRRAHLIGIAVMTELKGAKKIRMYTHDDCGLLTLLGITDPSTQFIYDICDRAATAVTRAVAHLRRPISVAAHNVKLDPVTGLWSIDKPLVVANAALAA